MCLSRHLSISSKLSTLGHRIFVILLFSPLNFHKLIKDNPSLISDIYKFFVSFFLVSLARGLSILFTFFKEPLNFIFYCFLNFYLIIFSLIYIISFLPLTLGFARSSFSNCFKWFSSVTQSCLTL